MHFKSLFILILLFAFASNARAQQTQMSSDSLKQVIMDLRADVDQINLNLDTSKKKFKKGILISTIGYSITIAGGLMLGRKNDDLGKALLVVGGGTGITGTVMMVDSFNFLTGGKKKKRKR